jgi:hypothetical protein
MKRYLIILTLYLCAVVPTMAQYYSVNYDKRTVEAMTAAFATEAATEAYYAEQVAKIREHYQAAEVAAAGIFTSKFLDRKALTHLDKFDGELLLPPYLQHGVGQDHAEDMDCSWNDAQKSTECSLLGKLFI